jgi:hypothetical protein
MFSHLKKLLSAAAIAFAVLASSSWLGAQSGDVTGYPCPGCVGKASPAVVEIPPMRPDGCYFRYNFKAESGSCLRPEPHPSAPCNPASNCKFSVFIKCIAAPAGNGCGQHVQGVFSLNGTVMPIFIPCWQDTPLGEAACGSEFTIAMFAFDLVTGALATVSSKLTCEKCEN